MNVFVCVSCKKEYPLTQPRWKCECGSLLDIKFTPYFDKEKIKQRKPDMWRYREALPLENDNNIISFGEGFTPLTAFKIGGKKILIKQDHLFPSGSYKDRGAAVMVSKLCEWGVQKVVEDSSGNAGCAVAAYCARAGIQCDIYVPAENSAAKLVQISSYGARLYKIPGTREDTAAAVLLAAEQDFYASHSWNPFFFQGTKTFAFEVCEQLGWKAPDVVILPAGNGTLLLGASIGFNELFQAGVINRLPRIIAVQSGNCAPLSKAFKSQNGKIPSATPKDTLAEGIAIASPVRGQQILHAVRQSGGSFITVSEEEIKDSLLEMFKTGAFIEPTSAAVTAAVKKYAQSASHQELIVSVFTGHGLKAADKILKLLKTG